jgi:hypothetical protein
MCQILNCSYNKITILPILPDCQDINCSYNQLQELPLLPICLALNCSNNQLTKLPPLPFCLRLNCSNNKITQLPPLPNCPNPIFRTPLQIEKQKRVFRESLFSIRSFLSGDTVELKDSITTKAIVDYLTKTNLPNDFKHQSTVDFLLPHNLPFHTASRKQLLCVLRVLRQKIIMDKKVNQQQTTDLFGNEIVNPVVGDDGLIYDRSSMQQYFRKGYGEAHAHLVLYDGDYINIGYKYNKQGKRVPFYKNMGGKKQLTRYFGKQQLEQKLKTVLQQQQRKEYQKLLALF